MNEHFVPTVTDKQTQALVASTPRAVIKKLKKGGASLDYVEHGWVTGQLNQIFGWAWDWEIVEWKIFDKSCMVYGRLTIRTASGPIVKEQFGANAVTSAMDVGDALKGASSDALKKCASLLGIALDLYSDDLTPAHEPQPPAYSRAWADEFYGKARSFGYKTDEQVKAALLKLGATGIPTDEEKRARLLSNLADMLETQPA